MKNRLGSGVAHSARTFLTLSCAIALISAASQLARADSFAVGFTGVADNNTNNSWSIGWEFSTNAAINVTGLGYYNASLTGGDSSFENGTCNCGEVGIYDAGGDLLTSVQVTSSDPVNGYFNYAAITPLLLSPGQDYYIAAETGSSDYTFNTINFTVDPNINYIQDAYVQSSTLVFPTESDGITAGEGGAYFGPNFEFSPAAAPEPASLALCGAALLGLGIARRSRTTRRKPLDV